MLPGFLKYTAHICDQLNRGCDCWKFMILIEESFFPLTHHVLKSCFFSSDIYSVIFYPFVGLTRPFEMIIFLYLFEPARLGLSEVQTYCEVVATSSSPSPEVGISRQTHLLLISFNMSAAGFRFS